MLRLPYLATVKEMKDVKVVQLQQSLITEEEKDLLMKLVYHIKQIQKLYVQQQLTNVKNTF